MDLKESGTASKSQDKAKTLPPLRLQEIGIPKLLLIVIAGVALLVLSVPSGWLGNSASETKQNDTYTDLSGSSNASASVMEQYTDKKECQLEEILAKVQGVGEVEVMITLDTVEEENKLQQTEKTQKVEGVLVVAQGAGDAEVDTEIIQAVQALFSIESHKIRVMKME